MVDNASTHGMHSAVPSQSHSFSRLFPNLPPFLISPQAALMLGTAMTIEGIPRKDGTMPAGYTYFGQFVDHDITRDVTPDSDALDGPLPAVMLEIEQARSPTLDLDSVYGSVPAGSNGGSSPRTGPFFQFGSTTPTPGAGASGQSLENDLPRGPATSEPDGQGGTKNTTKVLIPDDRNDENLIVAQMHLAWMKFHNAVARQLVNDDMSLSDEMAFAKARELVTQHYQHVVLYDFLKLVCEPSVWKAVIKGGKSKYCHTTVAESASMPLEFAVAAFRFGHTMIRQGYNWNANFKVDGAIEGPQGPVGPALFAGKSSRISLFFHTRNNLSADEQLDTNWIADWRRLLDFDGTGFDPGAVDFVNAAAFDPILASGMGNLERADSSKPVLNNLAASNLRRGALRGLPSAQDVSAAMHDVKVLTKTEMKKNVPDEMAELIDTLQLGEKAPLWFYILQEANARQSGKHLGEMGSILVAETFVSLVKASKPSIIASGWTPDDSPLRLANGSVIDTLPKVMVFCEENGVPIINPLNAD